MPWGILNTKINSLKIHAFIVNAYAVKYISIKSESLYLLKTFRTHLQQVKVAYNVNFTPLYLFWLWFLSFYRWLIGDEALHHLEPLNSAHQIGCNSLWGGRGRRKSPNQSKDHANPIILSLGLESTRLALGAHVLVHHTEMFSFEFQLPDS